MTVTSTHTAPTVSETKRYYYYVCVDTLPEEHNTNNNCSRTPAEVVVRVKPEDPGPPYNGCFTSPERSTPMGGDAMIVYPFDYDEVVGICGTITLGGLETVTGEQGFVGSAHVIASRNTLDDTVADFRDYTGTDAFIGHSESVGRGRYLIEYFLGKVFKMPGFRTEGEKKVLNVDAAFVAYPHPKTPGCSLTWSGDEEEFCLDPGHSDYIERLAPLTIRGENGKTHKVIGSKEPTVGLDVQMTGSVSGTLTNRTVNRGRVLHEGHPYSIYLYVARINGGDPTIGGDSGSPVYTVPDSAGNVHIVGILTGSFITSRWRGNSFSSWDDVVKGLDLKSIEDLAGLTSARSVEPSSKAPSGWVASSVAD